MEERDLLPGEWAVLAMLRLGPNHGYEIARCLQQDGLADVTWIEHSLLYAYLKTLERRGFITGREMRVGAHPPRRVFELTSPGETAVDAWLRRPVERLREVRLDFMLKLYFLHHLDPAAERNLLRAQIENVEGYVDRVAARLSATGSHGFERLVLGSKASAASATLGWLRGYAMELDASSQSAKGFSL